MWHIIVRQMVGCSVGGYTLCLTSFVNLFLIVMKFHCVLYAMVLLLIVVSSDKTNQHGRRLSIQSVTIPIYCIRLHDNKSKRHDIQNTMKFHQG